MPAISAASVNASMRWRVTSKPSARMRAGSSRRPCSARPNGVRDTYCSPRNTSTATTSVV